MFVDIKEVHTFKSSGRFSESLVAKFDNNRSCPQAWKIPLSNGPKLHRMITLTAKDAMASTKVGTPTFNV
jgi:hypothetical protein